MSDLPKVLLLGDSIRISYQPHVARLLAGRATVVGPAENCQTSLYTLSSLNRWIDDAARGLAFAIVAAISVIDVETVIMDGAFPQWVRKKIIERTRSALEAVNQQGLSRFQLVEGTIGNAARAMGGASLPLLANFTQDREVLFKEAEQA